MYKNRTKQLRNIKHPIIRVNNNVGGLRASGTKFKLPKNSYVDCLNVVISNNGGFKKRRTASQLGIEPDLGDFSRIYGLGYQKDWGYIRVKGDKIQTLATENATWVTITTGYTISGSNFVDFVEFKATATSGGIAKNIEEASNERYIKVTGLTPNEYIGKMLKIGNEIKLIIGNQTDFIFIQEKFEGEYANGTAIEIIDQVNAIYIVSPGQNVKIWRGGSTLETLGFSFYRAVLQSYGGLKNNGRLFGVKDDGKVHVSEVGTGEFFQKDSFLPVNLSGVLDSLGEISGRIVVWTDFGRLSVVGDNPDNFQVVPSTSHKGCIAPGSVANGNNVLFYLSHEGIELLNSIENATVTEGISLSDNIRKKFEQHTDLSAAHGTVSNGKYFLNIQGLVYIYDLEKSVKNHKPIFTLAKYTECSQVAVSNAVVGEWTASMDVNGQLVFGQGGITYRITDEKIGSQDIQKKLIYSMEFPIENMTDQRLLKAVQKYRVFFQNDRTLQNARTNIKVYYSNDEGVFELIRDVENIFDVECALSKKVYSGSIKIVVEDLDDETDTEIEFLYSELEYYFFTKR